MGQDQSSPLVRRRSPQQLAAQQRVHLGQAVVEESVARGTEKGLLNSGQNNCFLNVVLQSLFHVTAFREAFVRLSILHQRALLAAEDEARAAAAADESHESEESNAEQSGGGGSQDGGDATPASQTDEPKSETDNNSSSNNESESEGENDDGGEGEVEGTEPTITAAQTTTNPTPPPTTTTTPTRESSIAKGKQPASSSAATTAGPTGQIQLKLHNPSVCPTTPCILCSLGTLFSQFTYTNDAVLTPNAVREALSDLFSEDNRFAIQEMADAVEALQELLSWLHFALSGSEDPCHPLCLSHDVFGFEVCERWECPCGATSEPVPQSLYTYTVYVSELRTAKATYPRCSFEQLLGLLGEGSERPCPGDRGCGLTPKFQQFIQSVPKVFTLTMCWLPDTTAAEAYEVVSAISLIIDLRVVFFGLGKTALFRLSAVACYYGRHYMCFVRSIINRDVWLYCDDELVRVVGDWQAVLDRCKRGKLLPCFLMYEAIDASRATSEKDYFFASHRLPRPPPTYPEYHTGAGESEGEGGNVRAGPVPGSSTRVAPPRGESVINTTTANSNGGAEGSGLENSFVVDSSEHPGMSFEEFQRLQRLEMQAYEDARDGAPQRTGTSVEMSEIQRTPPATTPTGQATATPPTNTQPTNNTTANINSNSNGATAGSPAGTPPPNTVHGVGAGVSVGESDGSLAASIAQTASTLASNNTTQQHESEVTVVDEARAFDSLYYDSPSMVDEWEMVGTRERVPAVANGPNNPAAAVMARFRAPGAARRSGGQNLLGLTGTGSEREGGDGESGEGGVTPTATTPNNINNPYTPTSAHAVPEFTSESGSEGEGRKRASTVEESVVDPDATALLADALGDDVRTPGANTTTTTTAAAAFTATSTDNAVSGADVAEPDATTDVEGGSGEADAVGTSESNTNNNNNNPTVTATTTTTNNNESLGEIETTPEATSAATSADADVSTTTNTSGTNPTPTPNPPPTTPTPTTEIVIDDSNFIPYDDVAENTVDLGTYAQRDFAFGPLDLTNLPARREFQALDTGFRWAVTLFESGASGASNPGLRKPPGAEGYLGVSIMRLDDDPRPVTVKLRASCTVAPFQFGSGIDELEIRSWSEWADPFFVCPQRRRVFMGNYRVIVNVSVEEVDAPPGRESEY